MRWTTLLLTVAPLSAGCSTSGPAGGDGEPSSTSFDLVPVTVEDRTREGGEFWLVWVHGEEEPPGAQTGCDYAFDHEVDRANGTLAYDGDGYDLGDRELRVLYAVDHFHGGCPITYTLSPDPVDGATFEMGRYGNLDVTANPNGSLQVDDRHVPLGRALEVSYAREEERDGRTVWHNGTFTVENLGAWNHTNLRSQ